MFRMLLYGACHVIKFHWYSVVSQFAVGYTVVDFSFSCSVYCNELNLFLLRRVYCLVASLYSLWQNNWGFSVHLTSVGLNTFIAADMYKSQWAMHVRSHLLSVMRFYFSVSCENSVVSMYLYSKCSTSPWWGNSQLTHIGMFEYS